MRIDTARLFFLFISTFIIAFLTNPAVILLNDLSAFKLTKSHIYGALVVASNAIWNFQIATLVFLNQFDLPVFLFGLCLSATFIYLERYEHIHINP